MSEKKETPVIPMMSEKVAGENKVLEKAKAIQEARIKEIREEEAKVLGLLEEDFGLTKEKLEECKETEEYLGKPENKITTLIEAMEAYKSADLSKEQLAFMAINSVSRANFAQNEINYLQKEVEEAQKQMQALINITSKKEPQQ